MPSPAGVAENEQLAGKLIAEARRQRPLGQVSIRRGASFLALRHRRLMAGRGGLAQL